MLEIRLGDGNRSELSGLEPDEFIVAVKFGCSIRLGRLDVDDIVPNQSHIKSHRDLPFHLG